MKQLKGILWSILWLVLFFIAQIIATILSLLSKTIFDINFSQELLNKLQNSPIEAVDLYMNTIYSLLLPIMFLTFLFLCFPIFLYHKKKQIKIIHKLKPITIVQYIAMGLSLNFIISLIILLIPSKLTTTYTNSVDYVNEVPFFSLFLAIGILTPITEELIYRYAMTSKLKNFPILAILTSSFLFGVAHGNIIQGLYAFFLGCIFSFIYLKTNNLLPSIIMHMTINMSSAIETIASPMIMGFLSIISIIICGFSMILFIEKKVKNQKEEKQTNKKQIEE